MTLQHEPRRQQRGQAQPHRPASLRRVWVVLLLAMAAAAGGQTARADGPMREPLSPSPSSLAPVDTEAFRDRYGQEALFRLKLGVDAGERTTPKAGSPTPVCSPGWAGSAQAREFRAEVEKGRWFEAGQVLGTWRRACGGR